MKTFVVFTMALLCSVCCSAQSWPESRDLAVMYKDSGNIDSSLYYFQKALSDLPGDSANAVTRLKILKEIGSLYYYSKSQYADALIYYQLAAAVILKNSGNATNDFADNNFIIGQLQYLLKQNYKAEKTYLLVREVYKKNNGEWSKPYSDACNALGVLYNDWSRFEQAILFHSEAMAIRKSLFSDKDPSYAQSCNNLAAIYWSLGQLDKAEPLALEAKTIREHSSKVKRFIYAISCINLANIYRDMGKFAEAETLYLEARQLREAHFGRLNETFIQSNDILSSLYSYMRRYRDAAILLNESKSLRDSMGSRNSFFYAQNCSNLANAYLNMDSLGAAEKLANTALDIFNKLGSPANADKAITQNLLGSIFFAQHKNKDASILLQKARKYWKNSLGEMHPFYNSNTLALARIYRVDGETKKAAAYYRQAFAADQYQLRNVFSFTTEKEKEQYLLNLQDNTGEYFSFYNEQLKSKNGGFAYDILLNSRSRIFTSIQELRNAVAASKDSTIKGKYQEWLLLKKQLAVLYFGTGLTRQQEISGINIRSQQLEKEIHRYFNSLHQGGLRWKTVPPQLKTTQAVVEFFNYNYFDGYRYTDSIVYAAFVVKKETKEPAWVNLCSKTALTNAITKSYTIDADSTAVATRGVVKLKKKQSGDVLVYRQSWQPLEHELNGKNDIYLLPSGLLNRISFAALNTDSITLLSDKYRLQQISSVKELAGNAAFDKKQKQDMLLYGGIHYGSSGKAAEAFTFLPGTEKETSEIEGMTRHLFENTKLSGDAATESSFKKLDGHSPRIIHLATHGFYLPKPSATDKGQSLLSAFFANAADPLLRSGLAFAGANNFAASDSSKDDGILTAYEISNMNLSNTKLVVLSACETALGDIMDAEGVYGLQRAFKIAGVQYIIMSLWSVPDEETAAFMKAFYASVMEQMDIATAFTAAQTTFKNLYRNQPEKWAAWVLYQ